MIFTGEETQWKGAYGRAKRMPDQPDNPDFVATVSHWLITHPQGHPLWTQYNLCGLRLAEYPNMPPPNKQFPEATHEISLVVLNPEYGPYTPEKIAEYADRSSPKYGKLPFLTPINIAWQMTGTDEECRKLVSASAFGITTGLLWPETADAPERVRAAWNGSLTATLAHLRNEPHEAFGNV